MIKLFDRSSPLNSKTIYPKCDHNLYSVSITKNKMALWISPLPWAHFIFLFLLFKSQSLIITCVHTITMIFISCGHLHPWVPPSSFTWIGPSYLVTHLDARISPNRFHQLAKTKLGLSESQYPTFGYLRWRRWEGADDVLMLVEKLDVATWSAVLVTKHADGVACCRMERRAIGSART